MRTTRIDLSVKMLIGLSLGLAAAQSASAQSASSQQPVTQADAAHSPTDESSAAPALVAQGTADQQGGSSGSLALTGLPEVTVTAERYSENVETTPVAVTALTSTSLANRQVTSLQNISSQIPGIVMSPATGSSNSLRIVLRGADQEQGGINFDPAVGVYIDGVYQPRINGAFFDFFDISSLEVLRGPQGTLYGRNSSGGAIKITTLDPSFTFQGRAEVAAGDWNSKEAKLWITGPIAPGVLALSVSAVYRYHDGFISDPYYDRRIGNLNRRAERAKLLFTPTENFRAVLSVFAMQDYSDPGVGIPLQVGVGVVDPNATGDNRNLTTSEVFGPMGQRLNFNEASLNASYTLNPNLVISSITGYGDENITGTGSILWLTAAAQRTGNGLLNIGAGGLGQTHDTFDSQEFDLTYTENRLKAVGGVYYFHENGLNNAIIASPPAQQHRLTTADAVFGQATYSLFDGLALVAGLRYTHEDANFTQNYYTLLPYPQNLKDSFSGTTPKLGLNWQINQNVFTYFSYTKGFKSGGINPIPPNTNTGVPGRVASPLPYGPEKVTNYEVGAKFQTTDHIFQLNTAIFDAEYSGLQLPVFFPGTSSSYTSNASGASIKGIELEPTWQVIPGLRIYGNAAFYTGKYTAPFVCSLANGAFADCSHNKIKGVMPGKEVLGFDYTLPLPMPGQLTLTGQGTHTTHYYNNVANQGPLVQTYPVTIYNASLIWNDSDARWRVALECTNLTNKHYVVAGLQLASPAIPSVTGYVNDPRVIMVRADYQF
jgi:iron complex outermembrane receptor protein